MRSKRILVPLAVVSLLVVTASSAQPTGDRFDHLKCFRIRDQRTFSKADALLEPLMSQFAIQNCSVKAKAKLYCSPSGALLTSVENGAAIPVEGQDLSDDRLCYRIKCPKEAILQQSVVDPLGIRDVEQFKAQLLCMPVQGPPSSTTSTTTTTSITTTTTSTTISTAACGAFLLEWGNSGSNAGLFLEPIGVAVSPTANVYVADSSNNRVQVFDPTGVFISEFFTAGNPTGLAIDSSGDVYVAERDNETVGKFDSSGNLIVRWGNGVPAGTNFNDVWGIALDSAGNIYVTDTGADAVRKLDPSGNTLLAWNPMDNFPTGIAIDSNDDLYIAAQSSNRIVKFDSNGVFITTWGQFGEADGQFNVPRGVAADDFDRIYVVERNGQRAQKFTAEGAFVASWGVPGIGMGEFNLTDGVAVDSLGNVYVSDTGPDRIRKFSCPE